MTHVRSVTLHDGQNKLSLPLTEAGREVLGGVRGEAADGARRPPTAGGSPGPAGRSTARPRSASARRRHALRDDRRAGQRLPVPVAEQPLHRPRTAPAATGPSVNLDPASTPANQNGVATSTRRSSTAATASAPGRASSPTCPGMDTPAGLHQTGAVPVTDMDARSTPPADRPDRRHDRQAPADLVRARRECDQPRGHRPDHQGRQEPERGPSLHRRDAEPEGCGRARRSRRPPGFAIYRDTLRTDIREIESVATTSSDLQEAGRRRDRPRRPLRRLGLHRRQHRQHHRANASHPGRRAATARRHDPRRRDRRGTRRPSRSRTSRPTSRSAPRTRGPEQTDPEHAVQNVREVTGTFKVPCYLDQPGLPVRLAASTLGADGLPRRMPGNTYDGATSPATSRARRSPQTAAGRATGRSSPPGPHARCTGTGCSATTPRCTPRMCASSATTTTSITCATDFIGMAEEDVCPRRVPALLDLSNFPPLPDRLQQGFLDFIFLGRLMSMPDGFAPTPPSSSAASRRSTRRGPLLLRQQPGRDRGRRADRGRARHHPHRPLRAGDELLDAADPQRRLRRLRARSSIRPIRTRASGRCCSR